MSCVPPLLNGARKLCLGGHKSESTQVVNTSQGDGDLVIGQNLNSISGFEQSWSSLTLTITLWSQERKGTDLRWALA